MLVLKYLGIIFNLDFEIVFLFTLFFPSSYFQGPEVIISEDTTELKKQLEKEIHGRKEAEEEVNKLRSQLRQFTEAGVCLLSN